MDPYGPYSNTYHLTANLFNYIPIYLPQRNVVLFLSKSQAAL